MVTMLPSPALSMQPGFPVFQQPGLLQAGFPSLQRSGFQQPAQPGTLAQSSTSQLSTSIESMRIEMDKIPGTNNWQVNYTNTTQRDNQTPQVQTYKNVVPQQVIQSELDSMGDINSQLNQLGQPYVQTKPAATNTDNPFGVDLNQLVNEILADMDDNPTTNQGHEFVPQQLKITIDL